MTLPPVFSTLTPSLANGLSMVASFPLNVIVTISPTGMLYSPKVTLSMEETGKEFKMPPALLLNTTEAGLVMKLMPPILLTGVSYKTLPLLWRMMVFSCAWSPTLSIRHAKMNAALLIASTV